MNVHMSTYIRTGILVLFVSVSECMLVCVCMHIHLCVRNGAYTVESYF